MLVRAAARMLALVCCSWVTVASFSFCENTPPVGIFENHSDIGPILHPGALDYDTAKATYRVSASGENIWFAVDALHFAWKKVAGDISLAADIQFLGSGGHEHRKAVLMFRQSLDPDSGYVDVAFHGNGMTALQYRDAKGELTHELIVMQGQANFSESRRLRIEKRGDFAYLFLTSADGDRRYSGASIKISLPGTYYAGIGLCSHDKDRVEKAVFSRVELTESLPPAIRKTLYSSLERLSVKSTDRQIVYTSPDRFEAPNWTQDGTAFLFNRNGRIYRLPVAGGEPAVIDTGSATRCNNDHGISPDQTLLAISDESQHDNHSMIYLVPIAGGTPRPITTKSPSYWHGWSPDGKTLAFVGQRNDEFDIYTIPATGGDENRLTTAKGLDDGPEYSPDGKYIYFNSERSGHMQIWRMRSDGSGQEQVLDDPSNDWFPHVSPDGKWIVFLSYPPDVNGHPPDKDVTLRVIPRIDEQEVEGKVISVKVVVRVIAKLFGGQGTINVPSWSPDSKEVALVSYAVVPDDGPGKK